MNSLLLVLTLLLQTGDPASGGKISGVQDRITEIDENLARLERRLSETSKSSARISDEVGRLELQRAMIGGQIEKHELELTEANKSLEDNVSRKTELEELADGQKKQIGARLRALYKRGGLGYSQMLLKQSRIAELIGAYNYAQVLTRRDNEALATFHKTIQDLDDVEKVLKAIQETAERTRNQLANRKKELEGLLRKRSRRLSEIRRQTKVQNELFEELDLEKQELHLIIRRLTEGEEDPMALRVPVTSYKGRLPWPCKGKLFRKFGIYKDPEFSTKRKQNGIDFRVPKGEVIKAIYSGKVIFADWFKSYGNLVIVDHGEKVISFYAHCDRLYVEKGEFVNESAVIATSGDTGSLEGDMLHFEIRHKMEPKNPLKWLASKRK